MHADYIANPLYGNNPFIEALPPMLSGKDLIRALAVIPPYSDSDRDRRDRQPGSDGADRHQSGT